MWIEEDDILIIKTNDGKIYSEEIYQGIDQKANGRIEDLYLQKVQNKV